ncbi:MAG: hypothetical protein RL226_915 [Bacteroidota bacterium]|jgi:DNA-binding response OmpR family regulator
MSEKVKILLVEDDYNLGFVMQDLLRMEGFHVHLATDGKDGLVSFSQDNYHLCLLDVMLPEKDGFTLAEDIRKLNADVPIVFITAKGMIEDKLKGLRIGADDYITKPFVNEEFLLRIRAILKRVNPGNEEAKVESYPIGSYLFDVVNLTLNRASESRQLTRKEADILKMLCEHANRVLERELIAKKVWGDDSYFVGRSMDVFITKLRKYLADDPRVAITNVHGVGFRLELGS